MSRQIELIFDIVSPNAYLAWWPLKELARRQDAAILVSPVFLGGMHKLTGNAPPMIRDADVKGKNAYAMLEMRRFIERHGLGKFRLNPNFPFNSITIQRMLTACEPADRPAFVDALLPPVWERGIDVADEGALRAALDKAGYDAEELFARAADPTVKQRLMDATTRAVDRGAFGVPTFYVKDEMFFGKERLGQIEDTLTHPA